MTSETTEINQTTADAATEKNKLPLSSLRLLGVISRPDKTQALLRAPDGRTLMVQAGHDTPFGRINAVGDDFVMINTGIGTRRLALPA